MEPALIPSSNDQTEWPLDQLVEIIPPVGIFSSLRPFWRLWRLGTFDFFDVLVSLIGDFRSYNAYGSNLLALSASSAVLFLFCSKRPQGVNAVVFSLDLIMPIITAFLLRSPFDSLIVPPSLNSIWTLLLLLLNTFTLQGSSRRFWSHYYYSAMICDIRQVL